MIGYKNIFLYAADFVKKYHFGGDFLSKPSEEEKQKKSSKDRLEEMIRESKMKKAEAKKNKDDQEEQVKELDNVNCDFTKAMMKFRLTEEQKEIVSWCHLYWNLFYKFNYLQIVKQDSKSSYNCAVRAFNFDRSKRSAPTDKLKTPEEIANEQKQKLAALEKERLRRMRGDTEIKPVYQPSADDLDDG